MSKLQVVDRRRCKVEDPSREGVLAISTVALRWESLDRRFCGLLLPVERRRSGEPVLLLPLGSSADLSSSDHSVRPM
jgi:hypothetical protein